MRGGHQADQADLGTTPLRARRDVATVASRTRGNDGGLPSSGTTTVRPDAAWRPGSGQPNRLTRKLSRFIRLSAQDEAALDRLTARDEIVPARVDLVTEGDLPRAPFVVKDGLAVRYRLLEDGGRQIIAFLIPGDLCDFQATFLAEADHSVAALTAMRLAPVSKDLLERTLAGSPRISAALRRCSMQEEAMLRERIVSLGRRDARARVAHLLCELLWRHAAVGLTVADGYRLPVTQSDLGDTLGLTPVHVNKVLRDFRLRGLLTMRQGTVRLSDVGALCAMTGLDGRYLDPGISKDRSARATGHGDCMGMPSMPGRSDQPPATFGAASVGV